MLIWVHKMLREKTKNIIEKTWKYNLRRTFQLKKANTEVKLQNLLSAKSNL